MLTLLIIFGLLCKIKTSSYLARIRPSAISLVVVVLRPALARLSSRTYRKSASTLPRALASSVLKIWFEKSRETKSLCGFKQGYKKSPELAVLPRTPLNSIFCSYLPSYAIKFIPFNKNLKKSGPHDTLLLPCILTTRSFVSLLIRTMIQ